MKLRRPILLVLFSAISFFVQAQNEVHFTQFEMSPIQLNPALAGDFEGTYRVGGIYRDQWFSVTKFANSFKTADFFIDVNVIHGLRKQDWVSVGLGYTALDQGGSVGLRNNIFNMGAAYHLANKKRSNVFTFGFQRTSLSSKINNLMASDARSGMQAVFSEEDVDAFIKGGLDDGFSDWEFGVVFNNRSATSEFKIGLSASRLFNPKLKIGNLDNQVDALVAAFAEYKMALGKSGTWIKPSILYMKQGPASELAIQGRVGKQMNENLNLNGGLGFRAGDAIQILIGADYKKYKIGASYDVNVSGLTAGSSTVGAFELALTYIGSISKKPKLEPVLLCPRL